MNRFSNSIEIANGKLFAVKGDRRYLMSECRAEAKIKEHLVSAAVLGRGRITDSKSVVLLITFDHVPDVPDLSGVDSIDLPVRQSDQTEIWNQSCSVIADWKRIGISRSREPVSSKSFVHRSRFVG